MKPDKQDASPTEALSSEGAIDCSLTGTAQVNTYLQASE
jgi:hypothetical protein